MTRLIDANALMVAVEGNPLTTDSLKEYVRCTVREQPTIDAEPRWVPCGKRLPEENGTYLVYAPEYRGGSSRSKEWHEGIMFASFKGGKWTVEHGYYSKPNCVKAWMPLPKTDEVEG